MFYRNFSMVKISVYSYKLIRFAKVANFWVILLFLVGK